MASLLVHGRPDYHFFEVPGSPEESYTSQEGKLIRTFHTRWDERWSFAAALIGWSEIARESDQEVFGVPVGVTRQMVRHTPIPYDEIGHLVTPAKAKTSEDLAFAAWLYPSQVVSIKGIGPKADSFYADNPTGRGPSDIYKHAEVKILFEKMSFRIPSNANYKHDGTSTNYVTRFVAPTSRIASFPFGLMKYADGSGQVALNQQYRVEHILEYVMIWHQVPIETYNVLEFVQHIKGFVGTLNNAVFENYSKGTVLMTSCRFNFYEQIMGGWATDVYMTFHVLSYRDVNNEVYFPERGHNFFFHFTDYDLVKTTGGTYNPGDANTQKHGVYLLRDFDELFLYPIS